MQEAILSETVERLTDEGLIGLSAAARLYGVYRDGKDTSPTTVMRHHVYGVPLRDGSRVHLEAIRISGRLMTSRQAVLRFFAAQNSPETAMPLQAPQSPRARSRAAVAADAECEALGII
jgi:hypothetical protein